MTIEKGRPAALAGANRAEIEDFSHSASADECKQECASEQGPLSPIQAARLAHQIQSIVLQSFRAADEISQRSSGYVPTQSLMNLAFVPVPDLRGQKVVTRSGVRQYVSKKWTPKELQIFGDFPGCILSNCSRDIVLNVEAPLTDSVEACVVFILWQMRCLWSAHVLRSRFKTQFREWLYRNLTAGYWSNFGHQRISYAEFTIRSTFPMEFRGRPRRGRGRSRRW